MKSRNILDADVSQLRELQQMLLMLDQYKTENAKLDVEEQQLEKEIENKEKAIQSEIQMVIDQRKLEITATYDEQLDRCKSRIKKIQSKKSKKKSEKVSQRIAEETKDLAVDNQRLAMNIKEYLKDSELPFFCNSKVYMALYAIKTPFDAILAFLIATIALVLLPLAINRFLLSESHLIVHIIVYIVDIFVFVAIYVCIHNATKQKNPAAIGHLRTLRLNKKENEKRIQKIKKSIMKDNDESAYGLQDFDHDIQQLEKKIKEIQQERTTALNTFDRTTTLIIRDEIERNHEDEREQLRQNYELAYQSGLELEDKIKELSVEIANDYEAFLGKDLLSSETIEQLITIMEQRQISTISEAVNIYKSGL